MIHDPLGDRMKRYESTTQHKLLTRTPVIIRIDGHVFHTYTRRFKQLDPESYTTSPYSHQLHTVMVDATKHLVSTIQGAVFAYTQSDEISILLRDWDKLTSQAWFDYTVQKLCSISAVKAANAFNFSYQKLNPEHANKISDYAEFDSRAYNIPREDVVNYFVWRQQDAIRNSVQMYGRYILGHKALLGKKNHEVKQMLNDNGTPWEHIHEWKQRGTCVYRDPASSQLTVDDSIVIFQHQRTYVAQHLLQDIPQ